MIITPNPALIASEVPPWVGLIALALLVGLIIALAAAEGECRAVVATDEGETMPWPPPARPPGEGRCDGDRDAVAPARPLVDSLRLAYVADAEPKAPPFGELAVAIVVLIERSVRSCDAMAERTSTPMRLNSSRHAHAPERTKPSNSRSVILKVTPSEQLKTTQRRAMLLAKSLTVSVLPVPAGPAGAAPRPMRSAEVIVRKTRSVMGVMTSRGCAPVNS